MKFSQRFPQVVTCGQSLLGTYCTRLAIVRYCPGENVLISASRDAAGRYVRTVCTRPARLINVYCLRVSHYCVCIDGTALVFMFLVRYVGRLIRATAKQFYDTHTTRLHLFKMIFFNNWIVYFYLFII